jgi:hypothetical protein
VDNQSFDLKDGAAKAVPQYWRTREAQAQKQVVAGRADQGARSAVTGGAQMSGFISLITDLILRSGVREDHIFCNKRLELPGFFRPTKEWDLLVARDGQLILALEAKSQVAPHSETTLITGPRRPWEALLISGQRTAKVLSIKQ